MKGLWTGLLIAVSVLLVASLTLNVGLWYQMEGVESRLNLTEAQLDITRIELDAAELRLKDVEAELGTAKSQLDAASTQLAATENELDFTRVQLESVEVELGQVLDHYAEMRQQINMRLGSGQDCRSFITPDDSSVSARVQQVTGGYSSNPDEYWRDFERLYRWVAEEVAYALDSYTPLLPADTVQPLTWENEFWRLPAETLEDGAGDCEDMAVLLASMLLSYTEERFAVWCVAIHTSRAGYKGHIAVVLPVENDKLTILDPAGNYYTGYPGRLAADDIASAVESWLQHWRKDMPGAQIQLAFSGDFDRGFFSNQEFIDWVLGR